MNKQEELIKAIEILSNISDNWDNDKIEYYPKELLSFDELVYLISCIRFKEVL